MSNFPDLNSDTCFQSYFVILSNLLKTGLSLTDLRLFVMTWSSLLLLFSKAKMLWFDLEKN